MESVGQFGVGCKQPEGGVCCISVAEEINPALPRALPSLTCHLPLSAVDENQAFRWKTDTGEELQKEKTQERRGGEGPDEAVQVTGGRLACSGWCRYS
ncbi:hypothetical protein AOLI_G00176990 [Acnodon oligacanthus]